jgi:hypothetical protein
MPYRHHERERTLEDTLGTYERRRVRLEEELREEQAGAKATHPTHHILDTSH